jgi:cysteine desulfurase
MSLPAQSWPELYFDANATTPVMPAAIKAARRAMESNFGNPSSTHSTGLRAGALLDAAHASARAVLGTDKGKIIFTSGATEGIQTAVLSALYTLRERRALDPATPDLLLYGATDHKAVPTTLQHWNQVLGLGCEIVAIPVAADGRHDLTFLSVHAARAALVCTMAVNNESGVISDLRAIRRTLDASGSRALWLVDSVQALGKIELPLEALGVDYAPFSGHKLYAPKGIGMLYVRDGAPFVPLLAGGGQETGQRGGTENMPGIAALGAVLDALHNDPDAFRSGAELHRFNRQLAAALMAAFPGLVFNAPAELTVSTTLNFSVPGMSSREMMNLFDAAGMRVSSGSACNSSKTTRSFVLDAMGLESWRSQLDLGRGRQRQLRDRRSAAGTGRAHRAIGAVPRTARRRHPDHGPAPAGSAGAQLAA